MKSAKSKRQFTLLTLVVALGVAVYLTGSTRKQTRLSHCRTPVL